MKEILSMEQVTYLLKGFILLVIVTVLLACSDDPTVEPPVDPPIVEPPTGTLTGTGNKDISEALKGTWKTRCLSKKEGTGSAEATWSFTMTDFSFKFDQYSDSTCSKKDDSSGLSGTYNVGIEEITSPEGYLAYDIDFNSSDGATSVKSLVSLSKDKTKFLLPLPDTTRPSDFSKAFEYTKSDGGSTNGNDDTSSSDLEGKWISVCIELEQEKSFGVDFNVKGDQFVWDEIDFTDTSCKNQDSKKSFQGTLVLGEQVTTDEGNAATELDMNFKAAVDQKRIYSKAKTESGRDVLILSTHDKGTGGRPTSLKGGLAFGKLDPEKSTAKSGTLVSDYMGNNEEFGHFSTPSMPLELNQGLKADADLSGNINGDLLQKLHEMDDLLLNQEGLRSGSW